MWGGSPATQQIEAGLETVDLEINGDSSITPSISGTCTDEGVSNEDNETTEEETGNSSTSLSQSTIQHRRELLDKKLHG